MPFHNYVHVYAILYEHVYAILYEHIYANNILYDCVFLNIVSHISGLYYWETGFAVSGQFRAGVTRPQTLR